MNFSIHFLGYSEGSFQRFFGPLKLNFISLLFIFSWFFKRESAPKRYFRSSRPRFSPKSFIRNRHSPRPKSLSTAFTSKNGWMTDPRDILDTNEIMKRNKLVGIIDVIGGISSQSRSDQNQVSGNFRRHMRQKLVQLFSAGKGNFWTLISLQKFLLFWIVRTFYYMKAAGNFIFWKIHKRNLLK